MIKDSLENGYLFLGAGIICIFTVITRLMLSICYGYWVKSSNSMDKDNVKSLERLKVRFETMYKMKLGVKNVDIFVDKHLSMMKVCGLYLSTWESISGQARAVFTIIGIGTGIIGVYYDCGQLIMLSTIGMCAGGIALTLFVDNLSTVTAKKSRLKINITDYLENYLVASLEINDQLREYPDSVIEDTYDIVNEGSYNLYQRNKLEKEEKKYMLKRIKLEKKMQDKKRKKDKKEIFTKVKKESKSEINEMRMKKEQEAIAEMKRIRAQKQKERKERVIEEIKQKAANENNIETALGPEATSEAISKAASEAAAALDEVTTSTEGDFNVKRILTDEDNKLIEDVLKEFLI